MLAFNKLIFFFAREIVFFPFLLFFATGFSQGTTFTVSGGVNYPLLLTPNNNRFNKPDIAPVFTFSATKQINKREIGVILGYLNNSFKLTAGPFFFPIDVPPSNGNTFLYEIESRDYTAGFIIRNPVADKWTLDASLSGVFQDWNVKGSLVDGRPDALINNNSAIGTPELNLLASLSLNYTLMDVKHFSVHILPGFFIYARPVVYKFAGLFTDKKNTRLPGVSCSLSIRIK